MNHHVVSDIDPNMGDSFYFFSHGAMEEDQIAGTNAFRIYFIAQRMQPGSSAPARVINSRMNEYPRHKAGAIESFFGIGSSVNKRVSDILVRFHHECCEIGIGKKQFIRNRVFQKLIPGLNAIHFHVFSANRSNSMERHEFSFSVSSIQADKNIINRDDPFQLFIFRNST